MRKLFPSVAAFLLLGALVLLDAATFPNAMQSFVEALGVADMGRCNYCHVEDWASDHRGSVTPAVAP
jgi:hypothetical protein